jgi:glycosyltransferase involved in cell wall biosynthesis
MKIIFDLRRVGLGNNGGSATLVKSGNALVDLGHDVIFVDGGKNQHRWTPLKAKHRVIRRMENLPHADFIIATGYKSVDTTVASPPTAGIKCHWIRGWELWQTPEQTIVNKILKAPTVKLVNGKCLQNKLQSHGHDSHLIRPGYDFDLLKPKHIRGQSDTVVIGGLNHQGKHINTKRTAWIIQTVEALKRTYGYKIELWMFGMDKIPSSSVVDKCIRNPKPKEKNELYNRVDIWLSPSMLEGLHMPPAEAMITECPVVGTNAEMSGTIDYLINNQTGIVTNNDISSFIKGVEKLVLDKQLREKLGRNARQRILEIGNRINNMGRLIEIFEKIKK